MTTRPGALVLVVGPSGAGKDTLLAIAKTRLAANPDIVFPRRLITRSPDAGGEDHEGIDEQTFDRLTSTGEALLYWRAHGLGYVVPSSARAALDAGTTVVCNVSRGVIDQAQREFANVSVVWVTAPAEVLAARLKGRGRESADDIDRRLRRTSTELPHLGDLITLNNIGDPEVAGAQLHSIIENAHRQAAKR